MFKQFTILPSYFGKFFLFSDSILGKYYKAFERAILSVIQLKRITERRVPELIPILAVSLQVMSVINPAVGCHYFPPGLQLPPQPLRGLLPILLLGEQRHNGCEQFA